MTQAAPQSSAVRLPFYLRPRANEPGLTLLVAYFLFIFSIPFDSLVLGAAGESAPQFTVTRVFGFLLLAAAVLHPRSCFGKPTLAHWLFTFYVVAVAISGLAIPGPHYEAEIGNFTRLLQLFISFWISASLMRYPKFFVATLWALGIGAFVTANLHFIGGASMTVNAGGGERTSALNNDFNFYGANLTLGIVAFLGLAHGRATIPGWKTLACVWPMILDLAFETVRSGSRGAVVSLILCGFVLLLGPGSALVHVVRGILSFLFASAVVAVAAESDSVRDRFSNTFENGALSGREFLYPTTLQMIRERPIVGWGSVEYRYELYARTIQFFSYDQGRDSVAAHNEVLTAIVSTGLLGAIPYFLAFAACWSIAWRARKGLYGVVPLMLLIWAILTGMSMTTSERKTQWVTCAVAAGSVAVVPQRRGKTLPAPTSPLPA